MTTNLPRESLISCPDARANYLGGMSRTTEWRMIQSGNLPKPIKLGHRSRYWRLGDLIDYLNGLEA